MENVSDLWVYLSARPLMWLSITCVVYVLAARFSGLVKGHPLANPVLVAATLIALILLISDTSFPVYFEGAQFVHFLLGPATVALAIPLWRNRTLVRKALLPMLGALVIGSITAIVSAVAVGWALGAPPQVLASLGPKSVTTPIAMGISETLGGIPTLTAVLVIMTGILGAIAVTPLMNLLRLQDMRARGFAAGVAAHGIGTARAFQVDPVAGTFAGIAMALNGALTALIVPLLLPFFLGS